MVFHGPKLQFKGVLSVKKMHSEFGLQAHRKLELSASVKAKWASAGCSCTSVGEHLPQLA